MDRCSLFPTKRKECINGAQQMTLGKQNYRDDGLLRHLCGINSTSGINSNGR